MKNELRIGNLVNFKDKPRVVYQIRNSGCDFHIVGNDFHSYVWDAIKPIPLTEEWLLKLGFEQEWKDHPQTFFQLDITDRLYFTFTIRKNYLLLHLRGYGVVNKFEISTVHQLQNLYFALCGEELTIK